MGTIIKSKEGAWRAKVRRNGKYASRTFRLKTQAHEWVRETEHLIDMGGEIGKRSASGLRTIGARADARIKTDIVDALQEPSGLSAALVAAGNGALSDQSN